MNICMMCLLFTDLYVLDTCVNKVSDDGSFCKASSQYNNSEVSRGILINDIIILTECRVTNSVSYTATLFIYQYIKEVLHKQ